MEMPDTLRGALAELAEDYPLSKLKQAVSRMTEVYRNESGCDRRLVFRDADVAAYALVRMPATFAAVSAAFSACQKRNMPGLTSVLDVGAGTGAASWAVGSLLEEDAAFTCLEREPSMIRLGKRLAAGGGILQNCQWICGDDTQTVAYPEADLVVASYTLNELSEENRKLVLERLWRAAKKVLLLVETGTPTGFCIVRSARETLLKAGAHLIAPCPTEDPCPMEPGDWCHFTARAARSRVHKALKGGDVPYEDEKFAYAAFSRVPVDGAAARVLRHPVKEAGRISLQLCTGGGIKTETIYPGQKALFKLARKASAGDEF